MELDSPQYKSDKSMMANIVPSRTRDLVNQKLNDAKLQPETFYPTGQCIFFDNNLDTDNIKLLELDTTLVQDLEAGKSLTIKGEKSENAVVVTEDKTYELRAAETSNIFLITRNSITLDRMKAEHFGTSTEQENQNPGLTIFDSVEFASVRGVFSEYLEVRPTKPRLQKLRCLLEENLFSGRVNERDEDHQGRKYSKKDLLDMVQASEAEVEAELKRLNAVEIGGYWRLLDTDYFHSVLNHVLGLIDENSWPLDQIPVEEVIDILKELEPEEVILSIMLAVGQEKPPEKEERLYFILNQSKVARNFAEVLLQKAGRFNLNDFLSVWGNSLPEGFDKPKLTDLRGIGLVDALSMPPSVAYFPRENLPEEAGPRFDFLFQTREKWTKDDIEPYLADLSTAKVDIGALLLKFARSSTVNGVKYFSTRKALSKR